MIAIIGLGNPGKNFEATRHNAGFLVLDNFQQKKNFPDFKFLKAANALISKKNGAILVKPQTFMNESGKSVKKIISNFKISNLIVVHDDIDLPLGKIKIVKKRGSAGHKGVESIIKIVGNKELVRIRIGIAPKKEIKAKQIVLKSFNKKEKAILNDVNEKTVETIDFLLKNGLEKAMNKYN
ncbi:MAG: aminoacyl-tRNA hydrolase [Candidatus Staskawiczbacteria bacterium]|nr:aminoacyl-tRNA hydrolase [Candidatus Staskawiczbacteria bacterium]